MSYRLVEEMRGEHGGAPLALFSEQRPNRAPGVRIHPRSWFIEEESLGSSNERDAQTELWNERLR